MGKLCPLLPLFAPTFQKMDSKKKVAVETRPDVFCDVTKGADKA